MNSFVAICFPSLLLCSTLLPAEELPLVEGSEARFRISDTVAVPSPPRFGLNLDPPAMSHWAEEPFHNQWWGGPNPNPIEARVKLTATDGGADFIECARDKDGRKGPGMGWYDVFRDGFFDGGDVWVWRYQDGKARYVRRGTIVRYQASNDGANRITLDGGPAVQAGDEFVIRVVRRDIPKGSTRTMEGKPEICARLQILDARQRKVFLDAGGRMDIDADAPASGGGGSLRIVVPKEAGTVSLGYWLISNQQPDWPRFKEGAAYELSFWAKQQNLTAPVDVQVGAMAKSQVSIRRDWTRHTIAFRGAPPKATDPLTFSVAGPGTLNLDNIFIHEIGDTPPHAFYPVVVETLRRFQPQSIRLWTLQCNRGFGRSLDAGLGPIQEANLEFGELAGGQTAAAVDLHQELELCAQVGADPWIIVSTQFSPYEYLNLVEYLAGGPETPYGKKRAARGRTQPWTDAFHQISLELGNETWNGMFGPQGFSGRPKEYGQYADLVFRTMAAAPSFDRTKFRFILNGWIAGTSRQWGYGPVALENCPSADVSDLAYYTGGWDAVGLIKADSLSWGWFNILTYSYRMLRPRTEECAASIRQIAQERGKPVQIAVYEAGPGYTLPGPGKFDLAEQREGKSLAQAINSLDSFMLNLANGFGDQAFFMFRNGHYWSSHNRQWGEHLAWKALGLRNSQLRGDLITATPIQRVTVDLPEAQADIVNQSNSADRRVRNFPAMQDVPLVACYPFKEGKRYSMMLYSRRIDGPTKVTLELPCDPRPPLQVYRLADDDPSAHNIDSELVTVRQETSSDAARTLSVVLPPASVLVLVCEAK